jgi:hypothetical protein
VTRHTEYATELAKRYADGGIPTSEELLHFGYEHGPVFPPEFDGAMESWREYCERQGLDRNRVDMEQLDVEGLKIFADWQSWQRAYVAASLGVDQDYEEIEIARRMWLARRTDLAFMERLADELPGRASRLSDDELAMLAMELCDSRGRPANVEELADWLVDAGCGYDRIALAKKKGYLLRRVMIVL